MNKRLVQYILPRLPEVNCWSNCYKKSSSITKLLHTRGSKLWPSQKTGRGFWMQFNKYSQKNNHRTKWQLWLSVGGGLVFTYGLLYKVKASTIEAKEDSLVETHVTKELTLEAEEEPKKRKPEKISFQEAKDISRDLLQRIKDEKGCPGVSISVSIDGQTVWTEGLGYSDVENRVPCTGDSVFRIASISKPITMAAVARLMETGGLDIDKPVQFYVPSFPEKTWKGEKVVITTRQLVSHLGGIRHYDKKYMAVNKGDKNTKSKGNANSADGKKGNQTSQQGPMDEFEMEEYFLQRKFKTVTESLELFKDDPLVYEPGTQFLYTTHGWTLISAVIEGVTKTSFESHMKTMLNDMGMSNTYLDENDPIIYNRGRAYMKNKKGRLVNTPYVDLSYKWAGGGLISNVKDVVKFGNIMLYSYQANGNLDNNQENSGSSTIPGYLKPETMRTILTPVDKADLKSNIPGGKYGMGWGVWTKQQQLGCCREQKFFIAHTGGAIGASSVLLILPSEREEQLSKGDKNGGSDGHKNSNNIPKGVVVAIIANLTDFGLNKTALDIAQVFERLN